MRYLIQIHALVDENDKSAIPETVGKRRPELDEIIPVAVGNDRRNVKAQLALCFRFGGVFPAQPAQAGGAGGVVSALGGKVIFGYHTGKIKAADHEFKLAQLAAHRREQVGSIFSLSRRSLLFQGVYPFGDYFLKRASVRRRTRGKILHQLAVGGNARAAAAVQPALGRQIRVGGQKAALKRVTSYKLDQKALSAAVSSD